MDENKNNEQENTVVDAAPAASEQESAPVEVIGVRFHTGGKTYYFDPDGKRYRADTHAIVETARGLEYGYVSMGNTTVPGSEIVPPLRRAVRPATKDDERHMEENEKKEREAFVRCAQEIERHKLGMKLVDAEYTFDNTKLLFYFSAEGRVDFRELVKDLASMFRCRIELRQIGIRDEAKMIGGFGVCGRPFCCSTFLSDFAQVSIKMAKEQNLSLNSAKISGACGRLMCCLRYEHETYEQAIRALPKIGSTVQTPEGAGVVIETQPLAALVKVRSTEDESKVWCFPLERLDGQNAPGQEAKSALKKERAPRPERKPGGDRQQRKKRREK